MTKILCIDPGPEVSGVVILDDEKMIERDELWGEQSHVPFIVKVYSSIETVAILEELEMPFGGELSDAVGLCDEMAIEGIQSYGMSVGKEVFETQEMIGRLRQQFGFDSTTKIYRSDVKMHLCHSTRAKDTNVSQAIKDLYPATGGGKTPSVGTKKQPGPLYGVANHAWQALGVGLTYLFGKRADGTPYRIVSDDS